MAFILLTAFLLGSSSFQNTVSVLANDKPADTNTKTETAQETQIPAENTNTAPWIASDKADYPPGALVTLNGGGWTGDSEVKIVIEGNSNKSQDWKLEKTVSVAADGSIEFKFNLPEWYIPQYNVTAAGLATGRTAATAFTDTGGSYSLDFSAYDPRYYDFKLPCDYPTPPSGSAEDPMPVTNSSNTVESLEPKDLALGQIVPYEVKITVNGSTVPENGVIKFNCSWDTVTTNGSKFGFDPAYKVFAAFVDTKDPYTIDPGKNASAKILDVKLPDKSNTLITGTFEVSGLDNGDRVIVEMWVVLQSELPDKVSGNVQASLDSAVTGTGDTINSGTQTVPLNQPAKFTSVEAEVGIIKSDTPDPLYAGDTLTYSITVTNNSADTVANGIAVTDKLDPNVTFISASDGGTLSSGLISWPVFALEPGKQRIFTVTVKVNPDAPTNNCTGTAPDTGSAALIPLADADILNIVQFIMITKDPNPNNNIWYEPTNVLPKTSITAYKVWVGGPEKDHVAVTLTLYRQVGSSPREEVTGIIPVITPSSGTAGKFTYTWNGLPMYDPKFQPYIYTVDESTVPANYTKTISEDKLTITNTYKPSLNILKVFGNTSLEGAVFELYAGDDNGRTGEPLKSVTTGQDGKAAFEHLTDGTYWLVEIKPPTGYKFINDVGPIKVAQGTITGPAGFTLTADGTTGNYIITIPNEPVRELPATGGTGTLPFAAAGLGLMTLSIFLKKKGNKVESRI